MPRVINRFIYIVGMLFILEDFPLYGQNQTDDQDKWWKRHMNALLQEVHDGWVTPELKPLVVQKLQALMMDPHQTKDTQLRAMGGLALMGDENAMRAIINIQKSGGSGNYETFFSLCLSNETPALYLPDKMDVIMHGDDKTGNISTPTPVDGCIESAFFAIEQYDGFPQRIRDWAKHDRRLFGETYLGHGRNSLAAQLLYEWWEHNKDAIEARRYDQATWLPSQEDDDTLFKERFGFSRPGTKDTPKLSVDAVPLQKQQLEPNPKPILAQVAPDSDGGWELPIILSIIITTALAGGFWLYLYTSPKKI